MVGHVRADPFTPASLASARNDQPVIAMRRISSKMTFFYKRIFPTVWFGFLAFIAGIFLIVASQSGTLPPLPFLLIPAGIALFGYFIMDKLIFDLVDEVLDDNEALIIKNGDKQARVELRDIMNVGFTQFANPPRVTLSLKKPGPFGSQVAFCSPLGVSSFSANPLVKELIQRIDARRLAR